MLAQFSGYHSAITYIYSSVHLDEAQFTLHFILQALSLLFIISFYSKVSFLEISLKLLSINMSIMFLVLKK